ncbi:HD-GYP domain-containing protein [Methylotuvimicrobium buryatense]|uniref:Two-component system response regulator n=1 Tax=Methylotuvimicrobium buryatense TaxID=95641 RepID=A0A4P9UM37_METBY|nr:two-component system response regulator [Methylotuvimicrobium buryatense]QCW82278.1 two-component system response regulator [Methylotuvimicrobium buryatense]
MTQPTVLIVDDEPSNLALISEILKPDYSVRVANSGLRGLMLARAEPVPDLILLDVMMPDLSGHDVLQTLKSEPSTQNIPVIFITALDSQEDQVNGFQLGAVDYITKPIMPPVVLARVQTHIDLKSARDRLFDQNKWLESEVKKRMLENDLIQQVSIRALAHLAETRDPETGNHILRTQHYVRELAIQLKQDPRFNAILDDHYIELLTRSAPLHDIGKVAIPDHILLKPGPLTDDEWVIMKTHAERGAAAIELAEQDVAINVDFLMLAKEIAHWHHERWDGSGYPDELSGDAIPLSARIMAVADVFDALTTKRVYKPPMPFGEARDLIVAGRGSQFDPDMIDAFQHCYTTFKQIAKRFDDDTAASLSAISAT